MHLLLSLMIIAILFCILLKQYYTIKLLNIVTLLLMFMYMLNNFVLGWSIDGGDIYKFWGFFLTAGLLKPVTAQFKNGNIFPILICCSKWTFQRDAFMRAFELDAIQIRSTASNSYCMWFLFDFKQLTHYFSWLLEWLNSDNPTIFEFFANFWVTKLKPFSEKVKQSIQSCLNQNLAIGSFLENRFGGTLNSKTNLFSV